MRRKLPRCRSDIPEYVVNTERLVDAPNDNKKDIETARALIDHYEDMPHDGYVRPIQILVCGRNPRALTAVVDEIIGSRQAYRANSSNLVEELIEILDQCSILIVDMLDNDFDPDCPYMLGVEGVIIWMMKPGEEADKLDTDYRIDVKEMPTCEARQKLKRSTYLPFEVIDTLLESKKDPWQIGELLQLLIISHEPEELDFIGKLVRVPLCSFDWVETLEDEEYDQEDDLGEDDEDAIEMDEGDAEVEKKTTSQNESFISDKQAKA